MKSWLTRNKFVVQCIMVLMVFTLLVSGCATAKKPAPIAKKPQITTPSPSTTPTPSVTPRTSTTNTSKQVVDKASSEAKMVKGVRSATAVVSAKTLYVGLDVDANMNKQMTQSVEKSVLDRVKKMEPGYKVVVTSDMDTVTRLKKIAEGVAMGKPLTSFKNEMDTINSRTMTMTK